MAWRMVHRWVGGSQFRASVARWPFPHVNLRPSRLKGDFVHDRPAANLNQLVSVHSVAISSELR